ncbi:unnamed protein product, partial [Cladocopium goreaui]
MLNSNLVGKCNVEDKKTGNTELKDPVWANAAPLERESYEDSLTAKTASKQFVRDKPTTVTMSTDSEFYSSPALFQAHLLEDDFVSVGLCFRLQFAIQRAVTKRGLMAEYESTTQKYNLGAGAASSPAQKAALNRLKDLRELKVTSRLGVEVGNLYQQKPQQDIQLFLAGKSLKYCKLKTTSCQTGDDDVEIGINTEEIWTEEKEMQFPTLTGQAS